LALVRLIALQSALQRTVGREGLERKDDALEHRLLENLGATDLSKKNKKKKTKKKPKLRVENKNQLCYI
jgi:hypothetical protein